MWIFLLMKVMMIGSFSIDDGDGSENVTFRMNSRFLNFVAFIPICRKCLMQLNFPGVDNLGTALKFRKREKRSSWLVYALHKKVKLGIFTSQSCRDGKEMYNKARCTCKVVVLLNKPIALTPSLPSPYSLLKLPDNYNCKHCYYICNDT